MRSMAGYVRFIPNLQSKGRPMAIPFEIPKLLDGFISILEWLSGLPLDELNDDLDTTKFELFLQSRYGHLEADEFEKQLKADRKSFNKLVEKEGARCPWLGFLQ